MQSLSSSYLNTEQVNAPVINLKGDAATENFLLNKEKFYALPGKSKSKFPEFTGETVTAVDLFCGAGGTSTGLALACEEEGIGLDLIAINHDRTAIATHAKNHRRVRHLCQSIQELNPLDVVPSGRLDILIASPECTNFSKAKGGKPRSDQSRASARLVLDWLTKLYVKYLFIENVEEFQDYGPLGANGQPLKSKKGILYQEFLYSLRNLGYTVETRVLNAADYGSATSRRRLIILATRSRRKMQFPDPVRAKIPHNTQCGKYVPAWRSASEIIDWSIPGQSVFDRSKPLVDKTLYRIFTGLKKFCNLEFLETYSRHGYLNKQNNSLASGVTAPVPAPYLVVLRNNSTAQSINSPIGTLCASGLHFALASPTVKKIDDAATEVAFDTSHGKLALMHPETLRALNEKLYLELEDIKRTAMRNQSPKNASLQNYGVKYYKGSDGFSLEKPLPTITAQFNHLYLARPYVVRLDHFTANDNPRVMSDFGEIEIFGLLDIDFRMLSNSELSLSMGFPSDYHFVGTKKCITKQIGNAVSVDLAKAVMKEFIKVWRKPSGNKTGNNAEETSR